MKVSNQFRLLRERRFLPFLISHGLGALNDNLLRNVVIFFVAYQAVTGSPMRPQPLTTLAGGLYILPLLIFSGLAAQLAERYDKACVLKGVKALEVGIMVTAAVGLVVHHIDLLLSASFLMGLHATLVAPAKYGMLPQVLRSEELIGGNGMVQAGTFLAIALGTLAWGSVMAVDKATAGGLALVVLAVAGFSTSLAIPASPTAAAGQPIQWNPLTSALDTLRAARESRTVLLSVLGISWFWFYGALLVVLLPLYSRDIWQGGESIVTLTVVVFSLGVGAGALMCERLSGGEIEVGLVPFGSFGLTFFALDWAWGTPGSWRILFDIGAIGICGGLFVVPLNALVQQRSSSAALPQIIGASSILNALFTVAASVLGAAGLARGLTIPQLIVVVALMNAAVALYIYRLVPEFLLRFVCWLLVHLLYRLQRSCGANRFPEHGAALIVSNHVSFVDALVISAACRRPIRFIMDEAIFNAPVIRTLARGMKAIPIASAKEDEVILEQAFELTAAALRDGELVCIFPEGRLTRDGQVGPFRPGMMRILEETPVPVVPIAIRGLWGSMFSRLAARVWQRLPRKLGARISVNVGEPLNHREVSPEHLRTCVQALYDLPAR